MKRIGAVALGGVAVLAAGLALGLAWAHQQIESLDPALPSATQVLRFDASVDLPVRLNYINTASQPSPRSSVLEPDVDPSPDLPYVMSHVSFALEWADGRLFLIDLGMEHEAALAFGRPLELLSGADPMQALGSIAEQLGSDVQRVAGLGLTHLHTDHTQGVAALCAALPEAVKIPVFQTKLQLEETNYTTRPARAQIEDASCLEARALDGDMLIAVPGFPGLSAAAVAGHTPGSQIFVAHVRGVQGVESWVFTGDAVNHIDGVRHNLPKPRLYSLLIVPESPTRLDRVRRFLADLAARGAQLLVSHDQRQIESTGIEPWPARS